MQPRRALLRVSCAYEASARHSGGSCLPENLPAAEGLSRQRQQPHELAAQRPRLGRRALPSGDRACWLSPQSPNERARLYFLLAWFHAVIQERLRYAPLGWSKKYEFGESDLRSACDTVDTWLDDTAKVGVGCASSETGQGGLDPVGAVVAACWGDGGVACGVEVPAPPPPRPPTSPPAPRAGRTSHQTRSRGPR